MKSKCVIKKSRLDSKMLRNWIVFICFHRCLESPEVTGDHFFLNLEDLHSGFLPCLPPLGRLNMRHLRPKQITCFFSFHSLKMHIVSFLGGNLFEIEILKGALNTMLFLNMVEWCFIREPFIAGVAFAISRWTSLRANWMEICHDGSYVR